MTHRKLLVLVRHAKAESQGPSDHERTLSTRGREDSAALGEYLREKGLEPDHAVVSTATRAQETWSGLAAAAAPDLVPQLDAAVYTGSADVALEALQVVPEDADVVVFVGHNPTVASLAHGLEDGDGDPEATQAMLEGFPPGSTAVLELPGRWVELGPESCRLVDFRPGHPH